ncbi:unnamed protein product [Heligmosomoides polygyrus]|uniref:Non-structural maintenance of chromosomes element 4 n=1 Tax=Heligmosomoides polygyrus TaxID=6339 RepID=A0A183FJQ3_HELPZ|nr:unnamed protein product [Heligmosomoides polygyrus]
MPLPLRHNNGQNDDEDHRSDDVGENGLTSVQIQEANYLNSLAVDSDPSQQFARRASIREAYHDICSQFTGEVQEKETPKLIENLEKSLLDVERSYQNVGAGGKELAADADSLLSMANVLWDQMKSFRSTNSERVVHLMNSIPSTTNSSTPDGEDNPLLIDNDENDRACSPSTSSEATSTSVNRRSLPNPPKKERVKRAKDALDDAVVLTSRQTVSVDDEVSVAQELDKVRKALKRAWRDKPSVDFYSFVLDPNDFSRSVENMFYVSFLVKDGRVRLSVGDDGLPVLSHVSSEERQRLHVDDRSAAVTNQAIISFNYDMWENMVEAMHLRNTSEA